MTEPSESAKKAAEEIVYTTWQTIQPNDYWDYWTKQKIAEFAAIIKRHFMAHAEEVVKP